MLFLALLAVGGWFATRSSAVPASGSPEPVAAKAPTPNPVPAVPKEPKEPAEPTKPVAATESASTTESTAPVAPTVAASASTSTESKATVSAASKPSARPSAIEALPEEVREKIQEAETALAAGNAQEAIRLAHRSLRMKQNAASYSVLIRAHCLADDRSAANGAWRQGIKQNMSSTERQQVIAFCGKYGIKPKF